MLNGIRRKLRVMSPASQLQHKLLRAQKSPAEYEIYRSGLEWDLADQIVIESREDLKSETLWREYLEPYHHQVSNLILFCRRLPVTLIADDVGLGKTITSGLIISELISRARISKILIVCPKLLGPQWVEELLTKFDIPAEIAIGKDLVKAEPKESGAVITTYHTARMYLEDIPQDRFQMLILDEAHKLRNLYGVEKPPKVAKVFRKALEDRRFRFVLMLTATPIQNRLWDLYSLVDLLTVARGHENPFGSEGMFARRFIADDKEKARKLNPEAAEEFRSIVYSYMSRVRRDDAKLHFPDRVVQLHEVDPTSAELELIDTIAGPIQELNVLSQISILQALTSSPHALNAQLKNMAENETVPRELSVRVDQIVKQMKTSAKLQGLGALMNQLKRENADRWRLVVFTGRLETQTTIQNFLEDHGLKVGIINGSSGARNQETIAGFRKDPPDWHVIVSTEAGSEGVNLQVANVLVNYDLPWNPMIVEQRIGRIQRLASEHASVGIFNVVLRGTFEEYIVGRLMEKLQMASHAIGDIEALLEASGISGEDEGEITFEEKIRQLVITALAGKDVEEATRKTEQSIAEAKKELEREEKNINELLGPMSGTDYVGPKVPILPPVDRSMSAKEFTLEALKSSGAEVTEQAQGIFLSEQNGSREYIRFAEQENGHSQSTLYAPGTAPFSRLVSRIIASGVHGVRDLDERPKEDTVEIAREWIRGFGGTPDRIEIEDVGRCFEGKALVRARVTVTHDSYERLIEIPCSANKHNAWMNGEGLLEIPSNLEDPTSLGIDDELLVQAAKRDDGISEFSRFYLERREQEMLSARDDERKRKKLQDDFTPRIESTLVALDGKAFRLLKVLAHYRIESSPQYVSRLHIAPILSRPASSPKLLECEKSGKRAPTGCMQKCQISGKLVLRHLLTISEISGRAALSDFTVICGLSGSRVLKDEVELSAITNRPIASSLLKTSAFSGKRAEPEYFADCEFTGSDILTTEVAISEESCRPYRIDEQAESAVSRKKGHKSEFITCFETRQAILRSEAEQCDVTGNHVRPGVLEECSATQKRALPSELERCAATGQRALKSQFVSSNLSGTRILENVAVRSTKGNFCAPVETKVCIWTGNNCHPEDTRTCELTGLKFHRQFASESSEDRLDPITKLLDGLERTNAETQLWDALDGKLSKVLNGKKCKVESTVLSPDHCHIAVCAEVRTLLGLKVNHCGFLYEIDREAIVGRIAIGKRKSDGWSQIKN